MRTSFSFFLCASFALASGAFAESVPAAVSLFDEKESEEIAAPASGADLLQTCAQRMPRERILLEGVLHQRRRYGVSLAEYPFSVDARLDLEPVAFAYEFRDKQTGKAVLQAVATRAPDGSLSVVRMPDGAALDPLSPILDTDVTWTDASFDYLGWGAASLAGEDRVKGRLCDLLDVTAPRPTETCASVRLWVDRAQKVVLRAAQRNAKGRETRSLWIRAVKKVGDRWIFKDLEVETSGAGSRTRLHFDDVTFPGVEGDVPTPEEETAS